MDFHVFQERLRILMDNHGYTMKSLSDEIGISAATLSRYLSDRRSPDLPYIVKLAEFFNVSVDWLIGLTGDRYEILPKDLQEVAYLYSVATEDDRRVIQAVLNKYREAK